MTDRPILFSAPMVQALLAGRKTQTRRTGNVWRALHRDWAYRSIEGFPDYLAGRDGLIYSTKRSDTPAAMRGTPSSRGYLTVSLCGAFGIQTKSVQRLVAEAWLGPCPAAKMQVRHLNNLQTDNRISNLDWGTQVDNWSDRKEAGNGIHEDHHAAKLTMQHADDIRSSSRSQRQLAADYGVAQSTIWDIKNSRIWVKAPHASGRNIALPPPLQLWVRENCWADYQGSDGNGVRYQADGAWIKSADEERWAALDCYAHTRHPDNATNTGQLVPSIHMPRWASRLTLTVTDVRVQRVQDITEADAHAEGIAKFEDDRWHWEPNQHHGYVRFTGRTAKRAFEELWVEMHGDYAWERDPAVVALTFTVHHSNIDAMEAANGQ